MSDRDEFGAFLVGFIVGGLTGAVVSLLFAPQSGEETRALIKDKSIELRDKASVTAEEAIAQAEAARQKPARAPRNSPSSLANAARSPSKKPARAARKLSNTARKPSSPSANPRRAAAKPLLPDPRRRTQGFDYGQTLVFLPC